MELMRQCLLYQQMLPPLFEHKDFRFNLNIFSFNFCYTFRRNKFATLKCYNAKSIQKQGYDVE